MPPKSPGFQRKSAFYAVYTCFDGTVRVVPPVPRNCPVTVPAKLLTQQPPKYGLTLPVLD